MLWEPGQSSALRQLVADEHVSRCDLERAVLDGVEKSSAALG
jgi:hypothetical protein